MKKSQKIKILMSSIIGIPAAIALGTTLGVVLPYKQIENVNIEILPGSDTGVKVKQYNVKQGQTSTIELELPENKVIDTIQINVGNQLLTSDDYSIATNVNSKSKVVISIKASAMNSTSISLKVTIKDKVIDVEEIKINGGESKTIAVSEKAQLSLKVLPENATSKNVIWSSSDKDIVSVDQEGNIEGLETTLDSTVTISASATDGSGVIGTCKVTVNRPNFQTCSWNEINKWCTYLENGEKTTSEFCDHFLNNQTTITSMDGFLGLERTILINGQEHIVRVIDTQHDTLTTQPTGQTNVKAALTFELVTLLSNSDGTTMKCKWDASTNTNYLNSILRWNLNGSGSETAPTGIWENSAYSLLPEDLQKCIKSVSKNVAINSSVTSYDDKLFPLSATEFGVNSSDIYTEGTIYSYYKDTTTRQERRAKTILSQETNIFYWTRSPKTNSTDKSWFGMQDGSWFGYTNTVYNNTWSVSFAFCI